MYLDDIAAAIRSHIPSERMPDTDTRELLVVYAVLLRAKGCDVTRSDVHDAWSAWMAFRDSSHPSLVPYGELSDDVREEDQAFATAVQTAAVELGFSKASQPLFLETLFPCGPPKTEEATRQTLDLYKIMVASSESLVGRRQAVNTFFLTVNGALLTAYGLIVQSSGNTTLGAWGIFVLAIAGVLLCAAWRSLITSFGQLNRGKFRVINTIERYFSAAIYAAEWEALGRGLDPDIYRSFTSREIWVPNAMLGVHSLTAVVAFVIAAGWMTLGISS
jgi:hypothetical protein